VKKLLQGRPLEARKLLALPLVLGAGLAAPAVARAQPPGTDIFVATLVRAEGGRLSVEGPTNATARPGYDNQPQFTPDGSAILYTSIRGDGQADTYRYDLADGAITRVTRTPESEYSPTPLPGGGGFSAVRVEMDSTQRLWRFDADGRQAEPVLESVAPVGYHAWASERTVVVYVLGTPPTLHVADVETGAAEVVARDVGRPVQALPGAGRVSFVQRVSEEEAWIAVLDVRSGAIERQVRTWPETEDHTWAPDGTLLMAHGSILYSWDPTRDDEWRRVADLAGHGLAEITRLAVSPDGRRIALVAADPD
jgi:Tol biopolymer transport system component